jgi:competence protein ComEC
MPALLVSAACGAAGAVIAVAKKETIILPVVLLSLAAALANQVLWERRSARPLEEGARGGEIVTVAGVVTEARLSAPGYTFFIEGSFVEAGLPDTALRVRGYGELECLPGDAVLCRVRLSPLTGGVSYYRSRGIIVSSTLISWEEYNEPGLWGSITRAAILLRERMIGNLADSLPAEIAAVQSGMVLGDRSRMDTEDAEALNRAGTVHLMSVSGLHLSIVVGCLGALLTRLGAPKRLRAAVSAAGAVFFAFLTGFSPSLTRALIMTLIVLLGDILSRRGDSLNSLGFSLIVISAARPFWLLSGGLWLSASSTAGIAVLSKPLRGKVRELYSGAGPAVKLLARIFWGAGATSLSAYAFSLPVLLLTGGWASLVSPVSNVLIAPLATVSLLSGIACASLPTVIIAPFAAVSTICIRLIISISRLMAKIPLVFSLDDLWRVVFFIAAVIMIILLIKWRAEKALWSYASALLVAVFSLGSAMDAVSSVNQVEIIALNESGPTVLIRGDAAAVVGTPDQYEISQLISYLGYRGIKRVDAIIAFDCPEQVTSGLIRLAERYPGGLITGPGDDYVLGQMRLALPGAEVASSGYADITLLDSVKVSVSPTGEVELIAGEDRIRIIKSREKYEREAPPSRSVDMRIYEEGVLVFTEKTPPAFEPAGAAIFGERRVVVRA